MLPSIVKLFSRRACARGTIEHDNLSDRHILDGSDCNGYWDLANVDAHLRLIGALGVAHCKLEDICAAAAESCAC